MLKKFLPIFFILCLVFSLTVPCFAAVNESSVYLFQAAKLERSYPTRQVYTWGHYNRTTNFTFTETGFDLYGVTDHKLDFLLDVYSNHYYLFSYAVKKISSNESSVFGVGTTSLPFTFQSVTLTEDYVYYYCTCYVSSAQPNILIGFRSDSDVSLIDVMVFDLTVMGYDQTNYQTAYDDLASFGFDFSSYLDFGDHYIYKPESISQPFLNFYSGLFHTFDYFPQLLNEYSGIFILVSAVLALLIVIFVVVFMIKRFTGGKI